MKSRLKLIEDPNYPKMYRIKYGNGKTSDMFNLTWAKHHLAMELQRRGLPSAYDTARSPREARGCVI